MGKLNNLKKILIDLVLSTKNFEGIIHKIGNREAG